VAYDQPDAWSRKARAEGYPARSVYKLREIDEKFAIIRRGGRVLDLGAAPGSWSMYALRRLAGAGLVVACDLAPLSPLAAAPNLVVIQGDMTDAATRSRILAEAPYALILCDAAPATTGSRAVDTARSAALAETALDYAAIALSPGGAFVCKIFQGADTGALLGRLRAAFAAARAFKPKACRSNSFETYLIGQHARGPLAGRVHPS